MRKFLSALGVVLAMVFGLSTPAFAHSDEYSSIPANGETLSAVTQLQFTFAEEVEPNFPPETALTQDNGAVIALGAPSFDATNTVMTVPISEGALPDGSYNAVTRIVSIDGHTATYELSFTVVGSGQQPVATSEPTETPVPISEVDDDSAQAVTTSASTGPGIEFALASIASLVVIGTAILVVVSLRRRRNAQKD